MNYQFNKILFGAFITGLLATACSDDDPISDGKPDPTNPTEQRMFSVAGAIHDEIPGNGNGGTVLYGFTKEQANDPEFEINAFEKGSPVKSQRTARLQSSVDGSIIFNIAYGGDVGGEFSKYRVNGGDNYEQFGGVVNISQYAGTAPRWVKLYDGDKTGVAVSVSTPEVTVDEEGNYLHTRGLATVVAIDFEEVVIANVKQFEIPLTEEEEKQGYHIYRLDAPALNAAGDKLIIGTWMGKTDPLTGLSDESAYDRLGSKSLVVDYPSLENPKIITSTVGHGDTSGYRSGNASLGDDGYIYQFSSRETTGGSRVMRISPDGEYDDSYELNLDEQLGVTNAYIESWKNVGNGFAYVMYRHDGSPAADFNDAGDVQSFVARVDLKAGTAENVNLPSHQNNYMNQYQGWAVDGDEVYISFSPVGEDGNIYILNSLTGEVKKGAKLINQPGNHFIGVW
ncbi:hypothetical protein [Sinomicrobium sp.]